MNTSKPLIPAVVYLRMSSDGQEGSIEQQRPAVIRYAADKGYRIVRYYVDDGKSGSKEVEKRTDFQRLLLDATKKKDFEAVLCWDANRFARLDTIDGAFAKQILRSQGVFLDTVKEGKIDWREPFDRMKDFMLSEAGNAYSRSLSGDTVRGRQKYLTEGYWPFGAVPYGYDKLYVCGTERRFVKRTERYSKPDNWHLKLQINEEEKQVVEFIFDQYVNKNKSLYAIAQELNNKGIPGPDPYGRSQGWHKGAVKNQLKQKAYITVCKYGHDRKRKKEAFHRAEPTERSGICPRIISDRLFQQAQDMIAQHENAGVRIRSTQAGALSGFLICGNCSYRMRKLERKDVKVSRVTYACDSRTRAKHLGCGRWTADEREVTRVVLDELVKVIRKEALELSAQRSKDPTVDDITASHLSSLRSKLRLAERRMHDEEDDDLYAVHRDRVKELRLEVASAETRLAVSQAIESKGGVSALQDWDKRLTELVAYYSRPNVHRIDLDEHTAQFVDSDTVRGILSRFGVSVTLFWVRHSERGKWHLDKGRLSVVIDWLDDQGGEVATLPDSPEPGDGQTDAIRYGDACSTTTATNPVPNNERLNFKREVVFRFIR